jgi:hypothetical protein
MSRSSHLIENNARSYIFAPTTRQRPQTPPCGAFTRSRDNSGYNPLQETATARHRTPVASVLLFPRNCQTSPARWSMMARIALSHRMTSQTSILQFPPSTPLKRSRSRHSATTFAHIVCHHLLFHRTGENEAGKSRYCKHMQKWALFSKWALTFGCPHCVSTVKQLLPAVPILKRAPIFACAYSI